MKEWTSDWYNLYISKEHTARILNQQTKETIYYDITVPWPVFKTEKELLSIQDRMDSTDDCIERTTEALIRVGVKLVRPYETKLNIGMFKDFVYKVSIKEMAIHEETKQDILYIAEVPRNDFLSLILLAQKYDQRVNDRIWNFHLKNENLV